MPTSLQGIAKKAASQKGYRFRNLYGMLDEDFLKQCWRDIRKDAAAGVDHVSAQAYEQHLDENIHHLVERLKRKRYLAKLVRRHYNAWCEIRPCYQSTKSAKARLGRPSCVLNQTQKLCSASLAAKRA